MPSHIQRIPVGKDAQQQWRYLQLNPTYVENPSSIIAGGSQSGKTSLQMFLAAYAAACGHIVIILDPKLRFWQPFLDPETLQPLPHVLVYGNPDPDVAAEEWDRVLAALITAQQNRYEADSQSRQELLGDRVRFPTVFLVADEMIHIVKFADREWPKRKPDDFKGDTPVRDHLHNLTAMGAEAQLFCCFATQSARERALPAGTDTRFLCGQRLFLGSTDEGGQWRMLGGEGVPKPDIPSGQKGAGVFIAGDSNPIRVQCSFIDWKNHPERVHSYAAPGADILRRDGHIDDEGRLLLDGVPLPRPAQERWQVASRQTQLPEPLKAVPAADIDDSEVESAPSDERGQYHHLNDAAPAPRMIPGNKQAATYCGMSVRNFRNRAARDPIPGYQANYDGNKPAWPETALYKWALTWGATPKADAHGDAA